MTPRTDRTRSSSAALAAVHSPPRRLNPAEVSFLARAAWQAEGCPPWRRAACRREIELQLQATRGLLARELGVASPV